MKLQQTIFFPPPRSRPTEQRARCERGQHWRIQSCRDRRRTCSYSWTMLTSMRLLKSASTMACVAATLLSDSVANMPRSSDAFSVSYSSESALRRSMNEPRYPLICSSSLSESLSAALPSRSCLIGARGAAGGGRRDAPADDLCAPPLPHTTALLLPFNRDRSGGGVALGKKPLRTPFCNLFLVQTPSSGTP